MSFKDYYQILGIKRSAGPEEIKGAFRRLAMQYHPDRNLENLDQAEDRFKEINEAYSVLSDGDKRRQYDYLTSPARPRQRAFVVHEVFQSNLNATTIEELLRQLAAFGISFNGLSSQKPHGCRRYYGCRRRSRHWQPAKDIPPYTER